VLAGGGSRDRLLGMAAFGRGDQDGVDVLPIEQHTEIIDRSRAAPLSFRARPTEIQICYSNKPQTVA
jgi:hypothetical protein